MEAVIILSGLLLITLLYGTSKLFALPRLWREWQAFQQWRATQNMQQEPHQDAKADVVLLDNLTPLAGAGTALAQPPTALQASIAKLRQDTTFVHYPFPFGWYVGTSGQAELAYGEFIGDTNHILITGQSDTGKDNLALNILFTLALTHTPKHLQVAVIDGKGLDFTGWQHKAHTWRLALTSDEIADAMKALTTERDRRREILAAADVSKWDEYRGGDLPLLVVYISELSLLQDAVGKSQLEQWLNSELAAGRAFGIRYIVASQTVTRLDTRWRGQVNLFLAGYQPSQSQDEPNTAMSTGEIRANGGIPPSELPEVPRNAGVFTAISGRRCLTIRTSKLDRDQRRAWLQRLPDAVPPRPTPAGAVVSEVVAPTMSAPAAQTASTASERDKAALPPASPAGEAPSQIEREQVGDPSLSEAGAAPRVVVSVEERAAILAAFETGLSRRKVCLKVFGTEGGKAYQKVQLVCNEYEREQDEREQADRVALYVSAQAA